MVYVAERMTGTSKVSVIVGILHGCGESIEVEVPARAEYLRIIFDGTVSGAESPVLVVFRGRTDRI